MTRKHVAEVPTVAASRGSLLSVLRQCRQDKLAQASVGPQDCELDL